MKRIAVLALVLPNLVACAAFDWEEAEAIGKANTRFTVAAYRSTYDDWQAAQRRSTEATLDWGEIEDGWQMNGSLTSDGPVWTGAMGFDGSLVETDGGAAWDLAVSYDNVQGDDISLDGDMTWAWEVDVHGDAFSMTYEVQGEITATGEAEGTGAIDYIATVEVDGTSVSINADGDIGGRPVDFSFTANVPL